MTPDEFRAGVLGDVLAAWERGCFCASPGFRKLLSFRHEDYDIWPTGLADSEILIDEIIRRRFHLEGPRGPGPAEGAYHYSCPQCKARCEENHNQYSITMDRSYVVFPDTPGVASTGLYLVGFYGLRAADFDRITDFRRAATTEAFLAAIGASP